jgi:hypothetical protein
MLRAILGAALAAAPLQAGQARLPDLPMGVAWSPVYGFPPAKPESFMPQARALGASFARLTLYWSQIEPRDGVYRWAELDAYLAQLQSPKQGMLTIAAASPWATRSHSWVFPSSPALDTARYQAFVREVVTHAKGRILYFQSENEPNNPFFWAGSAADYAAQQRLFYQAVKQADPKAMVVLGASDGLFDPGGTDPFPGEDKDMAFVAQVLKGVQDAYDLFDLHLYGNPYTIPARVEAVRAMMRQAAAEKPIITSEYDGPSFFEYKANRHQWAALQGPGASPDGVRALRAKDADLPAETRMFLHPEDPVLARQMLRLQSEDLAVRNLIAFASGIERTAFFQLAQDQGDPDAPNTILYGRMALLARAANGAFTELPLADRFRRLATALEDANVIARLTVTDQPDVYAFRVTRRNRPPLLVAWRRPPALGETVAAADVILPAGIGHATLSAVTIEGETVVATSVAGGVRIALSDMPVLIADERKTR